MRQPMPSARRLPVNNLLAILAALMGLLVKRQAKKEQDSAQAEADRINDSPADWYSEHFRVRPERADGNKGEASKTDP